MPDKKLTDSEIVKALKTLLELVLVEGCLQRAKTISLARDLINRLQAENERLKKEIEVQERVIDNEDFRIERKISEAKAEAYKECIEKVNERLAVHSFTSNSTEYTDGMLDCMEWVDSKIEELEKELVGEE